MECYTKMLMAKSRYLDLQKNPSQMCDRVLNTRLISAPSQMFDRAPDTPPLLIIKNWYKFNEEKTMCLRENDADAFDCFNAATL